MEIMILILIMIFGAFINAARGGLISSWAGKPNSYDWVGRFGQAIAYGVLLWFLLGSLTVSILACVGMFLGSTFAWGVYLHALYTGEIMKQRVDIAWIDKVFPKDYENPKLWGVKCMTLRGLVWTFCIVAPIAAFFPQALYLLPVGALMGVVYYLSRDWSRAEWVWGAVLWGATYLILG